MTTCPGCGALILPQDRARTGRPMIYCSRSCNISFNTRTRRQALELLGRRHRAEFATILAGVRGTG